MNPIKILVLTANPQISGHDPLRLGAEVRLIQDAIQRSTYRDRFQVIPGLATRPTDLQQTLLAHRPQILHFSGHGTETQGLVLENDDGKMQLVSTGALGRLFGAFDPGPIECVFLNACYSEAQAQAIHQFVDCVIGMNQPIGDQAAILFAQGFYQALGEGSPYAEAFSMGRSAIDLAGMSEYAIPQLIGGKQGRVISPVAQGMAEPESAPVEDADLPTQAPSQSFGNVTINGSNNPVSAVNARGNATVSQNNSRPRSNNIAIGGSVTGSAITSGDNNTISVTFQTANLPAPDSVNIQAEIDALGKILATLSSPDRRKINNALEEIDEELEKPEPDKDEVGKALDRAMTYAQKANGFAEAMDQLRPHVEKTAAWLGQNWYKLLSLVGLAI
jgi:hypothetical protein